MSEGTPFTVLYYGLYRRAMPIRQLFNQSFPIIGCVHLKPLPGSPGYGGNIESIYEQAVHEAKMYNSLGCHGVIIENFGDAPFYPDRVPPISNSVMSVATSLIANEINIPIGINVLRNDAQTALSIATACQVDFIRINIHMHAMLTDQGIIEGKSYDTIRLKKQLNSKALIWADIQVKHAAPLAKISLEQATKDLVDRGQADGLIVSGSGTGTPTDHQQLKMVKAHSSVPVIIGSGITPENFQAYRNIADGAIVGSYFKQDGIVTNLVDPKRVERLISLNRTF